MKIIAEKLSEMDELEMGPINVFLPWFAFSSHFKHSEWERDSERVREVQAPVKKRFIYVNDLNKNVFYWNLYI
jgi:hypothetical protein